ncbi:sex peptide receptor-like isoform X2 [Biomphalaria glabrata]|uniref:Sex peptide receptor-like isoform X2 n=1 Tax=Biomphalaria glabrata TaxID=6526 RepID=A0A9W2YWV4_BIOGL|nr:sex peptide receptor-like isoform X2 [Biomphalaria glabrata]
MSPDCKQRCSYNCFNEASLEPAVFNRSFLECLVLICNYAITALDDAVLSEAETNYNQLAGMNETMYEFTNCSTKPDGYRLDENTTSSYAVIINGYISPVLVLLTVINNTLVCIVLLKPHMRSPTNAILIAMALSDMFTGLFPVPIFIHFYATERLHEFVPYNWCYAVKVFMEYIPTIFHTASIWLTMALAIQRYIYVCHSFKARSWCTIRNVIYGTVAIYVIATLSQILRFFENDVTEVYIASLLDNQTVVSTCSMTYRPWIKDHVNTFFGIYYWFRVIFINTIPCVSLVVMNALLIYAMRVAQQRRMQLLRQNKKSESRKLKESNCTTLMLVAVVGLFLLVEFPLGILMLCLIIKETFAVSLVSESTLPVASLFSNFCILLSYPLNFFIYCGMSKQFRETFKRLFTGAAMPTEREYSQYMTLPTENGKTTAETAITGDETAL